MKITFSLSLVAVLLFGCVNSNLKKADSGQVNNQELSELIGEEYQSLDNSSGQYTLAWSETKKDNMTVTKYAVYNKKTKEIVYNSSLLNGYVKWLSETELLVKDMPGIINADKPITTYQIDIIKKTKVPHNPNYEK